MSKQGLELGKSGEEEAVVFLKKSGYKILERNYRTRLGEIDIIGKDLDTLCFIEVKLRSSDRFGSGFEAVSALKQKQISKTALNYLKEKNLLHIKARFDVVALDYSAGSPRIELIKNAFDLAERFSY